MHLPLVIRQYFGVFNIHDKKKAVTLILLILLIVSFFPFNLVKAYAPVSISTVAGTYNSGNLDSILTEYDADYYHVTEIVADPAYDIRINFTGVTTPFQSITVRAQYAGANNHLVCIRLWNYTSETWTHYITLVDAVKQDEYKALVPNYEHHVSNDTVFMRICHEENGNINDDLYLDYVNLDDVSGWLEDWDARIELTLDSDDVDTSLINFPILIHLSDSSGINSTDMTAIFDVIGDDYNATAYTMGDGLTRLYFDPEYWNATEENAYAWIAPYYVSNLTDTTLYLYYDSTQDGSEYNFPSNVWDTNFVMVQHMNDETTSTILDSTSNDNDGTKTGANEPIEIDGKIGKGQIFDGVNDRVTVTDAPITGFITFETWYKTLDVTVSDSAIISQSTGFGQAHIVWFKQDVNMWQVYFYNPDDGKEYRFLYITPDDSGDWVQDTLVYLKATSKLLWYRNGVLLDTITSGYSPNSAPSSTLVFGFNSAYMPISLDETRISTSTRSPSWIGASYETQIDHFIYYSSPETVYSTDDVLQLAILAFIIALIAVALVLINSKK